MQGVCKGAGAPVLELVLPEEEEEDAQQENTDPNGTGLKPKQEVQHALLFPCCKCLGEFCGGLFCMHACVHASYWNAPFESFLPLGDLQSSESMSIFYLAGLAELRAARLQADYRAVYVMLKSSRWVRSVLFSMCKDVLCCFAAGQVAATDGMSYSPLVVCKACVHASCPVTPVADAD